MTLMTHDTHDTHRPKTIVVVCLKKNLKKMQLDSKTAPAASYLCIRNMEDDSCNPTNRQKLTNSLRKLHKPLKAPQISPPKTYNLTQKSHQKTLSSHDSPQSNTPVRIRMCRRWLLYLATLPR